ncbi:MAG: DUF4198 domain-containing protein, partial [Rhizobiales bacterium]|nr:DUF4198 domain-containing protein [Hyphomicrobiales bacterium]
MKRIARIAAKNRVLPGLLQSIFSGALALMLFSGAASAHEFWMAPKDSTVEIGDTILGTLNVGQDLKGNTYSYLPPRFERFTATIGDDTFDVQGRAGDNPALNMVAEKNGLHIFAYQSKPERLTYSKREKFENFLKYEGLDWVLAAHDARGLLPKGFRENYTRFAKALVQVGKPTRNDMDQLIGLPIELVALTNPMFSGDELL